VLLQIQRRVRRLAHGSVETVGAGTGRQLATGSAQVACRPWGRLRVDGIRLIAFRCQGNRQSHLLPEPLQAIEPCLDRNQEEAVDPGVAPIDGSCFAPNLASAGLFIQLATVTMIQRVLSLLALATVLLSLWVQAPVQAAPLPAGLHASLMATTTLAVNPASKPKGDRSGDATASAPTGDRLDLTSPPTSPETGATHRAIGYSDSKHSR
jgi:hypothetical protein